MYMSDKYVHESMQVKMQWQRRQLAACPFPVCKVDVVVRLLVLVRDKQGEKVATEWAF